MGLFGFCKSFTRRRQGVRETRKWGERETWRQGDRETRTLYRGTTSATIHIEAYFDSVMTNCIRDRHFSFFSISMFFS